MAEDPNRKTARTFQCRDYLWDAFEQLSTELECSVDYLVNEAMRHYLRAQGRLNPSRMSVGTETRPPGVLPNPNNAAGTTSSTGAVRPNIPPVAPRPPTLPPAGPGRVVAPVVPSVPTTNQIPTQPLQPQRSMPPPVPSGPPPAPNANTTQPVRALPPTPTTQTGAVSSTAQTLPSGVRSPLPSGSLPKMQQVLPGPSVYPPPPPPPPPMSSQSITPPSQPVVPLVSGQRTLYAMYAGQEIPVVKDEFYIGRGQKLCDLVIRDTNISRQHAKVILHNGQYWLVDNQSTNGVEYRGTKIQQKRVEEGDVFTICGHDVQFVYR